MPGRLVYKNAIVTGGGAGLGLAIARLLGREGAHITLIERDLELGRQAEAELSEEGIEAIVYQADVADVRDVALAFEKAAQYHNGVIHILVNNAGIAEFGAVEDTSLVQWERILAVNLTGVFLCSQAVLPYMKTAGGSIVNMASIAGQIGIPKMAAYCASKAGVIGLTRQMAVDYAEFGIRVNCLCPGRVAGTRLDQSIMQIDGFEQTQAKIAKYPLGRFGKPDEIAYAALFLATDESSFMTGSTVTVDGGMTAL